MAYFLGSVSQLAASAARGAWSVLLTDLYVSPRGPGYSSSQVDPNVSQDESRRAYVRLLFDVRPPADPALEELPELFQRAQTKLVSRRDQPDDAPQERKERTELDQRFDRTQSEAQRELTLPATLLVGKEPELFAEVDRLRAEGELRLAVVPPLIALICVLTALSSSWWLMALPLTIVLLDQGVRRELDSRNLISNAILRGNIKSASVERLRHWVDSLTDGSEVLPIT
jgi:hypothetical protein